MFTGIITDIGEVYKIKNKKGDKKFFISTNLKEINLKIGNSVSCSGVCLTLEKVKGNLSNFYLSSETVNRTNFKHAKVGDVINIGTNTEISIQELIEKIEKISGRKVKIVQDKKRIRPEKSEVERLVSNNEKILSETNWKPEVSLEKGLAKTLQWFENIDINSLYKPERYNV